MTLVAAQPITKGTQFRSKNSSAFLKNKFRANKHILFIIFIAKTVQNRRGCLICP